MHEKVFSHSHEAADVNGDGSISLQDVVVIKDFLNRGFGLKYNPGFQRVDYNGDGYIAGEEAQGAKTSGKQRCGDNPDAACEKCDDDPATEFTLPCL